MREKPESSFTGSATRKWFVAQAQPSKEQLAVSHLERQGFEAFAPRIARRSRAARGPAMREEALFPGYVFVLFDIEHDQWRSINGTRGVARLVSFGEHPAALPDGFVEVLRHRLNDSRDAPLDEELVDGASVRVVGGIFDELTGTILKRKSRERVFVLLDLLSGSRRVEISETSLIAT